MRTQILIISIVVLTVLILYLEWPSQPAERAKEIRSTGTGARLDKETGRPVQSQTARPATAQPTPSAPKEQETRATKEQIDKAKEQLKAVFQSVEETATDQQKVKIRDLSRSLAIAGESGIAALGEVVMGERRVSVAVALRELATVMRLPGRQAEKARGTALLLKVAANHESPAARAAAVALLGELKIEESLSLLAEIARTGSTPELRQEAALALGKIGSPKAVESLIDIARFLGESEQVNAIRGLAHCRYPEVFNFLLDSLSRGGESVRTEAALALGMMGDKNIATQLKDSFLRETSDTVATACARALANLQGSSETAAWLREQILGLRSEAEKLRILSGMAALGGQIGRDTLFGVIRDYQETESVRTAGIAKLDLPEFRESMRESVIQFLREIVAEERSETVRLAASAMLDQWGVTREPGQPEEQPSAPEQPLPGQGQEPPEENEGE